MKILEGIFAFLIAGAFVIIMINFIGYETAVIIFISVILSYILLDLIGD